MKIAIDCRMSGKSGIGTFLDGILPHFMQTENEFLLLGDSEKLRQYESANCSIIDCSVKMFSFKELLAFPKNILKSINTCNAYFSPYCNIPGGIRIPVFATIHDVVFLDIKELTGKIGRIARKAFYLDAVRKSEKVFTVSEFSRDRIIHHLKCKKKIPVVYNGISEYMNKKIDIPKTDTIIYIGNIKKHKGLSTLLKAYRILLEKKGFCEKLLIVGSGENFRTQDNEASNLIEKINGDFPGKIVFTGFVPDEKLHVLISEAKLLVQPSLYEGFGIPPLEALYSGTKAVISDIQVFKEIYEGFPVTYFHVSDEMDLSEKIHETLKDEKNLPAIPEKYSYKNTAEKILSELGAL